MDESQQIAIEAYNKITGRTFVPGDVVEIPTDALVFTEYQTVWTDLEMYKKARCHYDVETNDWLVSQVTHTLLRKSIPPIYVDILEDGVALVDGVHRTTAAFIAERPTIHAHLNAHHETPNTGDEQHG